MSEHGAALQIYNQELVKCLEELKTRKSEIMNVIYKQEAECVMLEKEIKLLQDKLNALNENLKQNNEMHESYDKTIKETEAGFRKILESSEAVLCLAQHEAKKLSNINAQNYSSNTTMLLLSSEY